MEIKLDMTVGEAMRKIVADYFAAVPYEDYTKQVFVQIGNAAEQSEDFARKFEEVVEGTYLTTPSLETIKDFVLDAIVENRELGLVYRWMKETLEDEGILDLAKKFSK